MSKIGMRAVDTNVLIRLVAQDNEIQFRAAREFVEAGAWVSVLVLVETVWVLGQVYELSADRQADAVEMLLEHKSLVVQDADMVASALELFRARPKLGFSDCVILHMARKNGHLPLGTFDKSLARADGAQKL